MYSTNYDLCLELRNVYPAWAKITPAKRRILNYMVEQGGEVQFWPGHIVRDLKPLRMLMHVGYVDPDYSEKYTKYRITEDGKVALAA